MSTSRAPSACALLALVAAIGMAADASAQYGGTGPGGSNRGGMGGMGGPRSGPPPDGPRQSPMQDAPLNAGALVQIELDRIEDQLKMTPPQQDAWGLYAKKVQRLADDVARSRADARTAPSASTNAVQRLEQIAGASGTRTSALDDIVVAGRAFYATLTDDQKVIADRRLWMPVSLLATGVMPPGMADVAVGGSRRPPM